MSYKNTAFKMVARSPLTKALKGNQGKLPQGLQDAIKAAPESPANQTTAGEFAHKQSIKDKEMGKSTKAVDKIKAAYDTMTTDKTYAEAKKGYRKAAKEAYTQHSLQKKTVRIDQPPAPIKQTKRRVRTGTPDLLPSEKRRVPPAPKVPVGPKAKKPKVSSEKKAFMKEQYKKRYK